MGICSWFRRKPRAEPKSKEKKKLDPDMISPEVIFQHYNGKKLTALHMDENPVFGNAVVQADLQIKGIERFAGQIMLTGSLAVEGIGERLVTGWFETYWSDALLHHYIGDQITIQGKFDSIGEYLDRFTLTDCEPVLELEDESDEEDDTEQEVGSDAG